MAAVVDAWAPVQCGSLSLGFFSPPAWSGSTAAVFTSAQLASFSEQAATARLVGQVKSDRPFV